MSIGLVAVLSSAGLPISNTQQAFADGIIKKPNPSEGKECSVDVDKSRGDCVHEEDIAGER